MRTRFPALLVMAWAFVAAPAMAQSGTVERATFTTAIMDREPQDAISELSNDQRKIYHFTELHDLTGQTVTHRWEYQGQVMAEVSFEVGGARWRVYSSKSLEPIWLGEWTVSVVDESGHVLGTSSFSYTMPGDAAAAPLD